MSVFFVTSAISPRKEINTLATTIYVAGAQIEQGTFAFLLIPISTSAVARAADKFTPQSSLDEVQVTGNLASDNLPVKLYVWHEGGKLEIGDEYIIPLSWTLPLSRDRKLRCIFVVETGAQASEFAVVENAVALLSNDVAR
jgi:hypothetical protein